MGVGEQGENASAPRAAPALAALGLVPGLIERAARPRVVPGRAMFGGGDARVGGDELGLGAGRLNTGRHHRQASASSSRRRERSTVQAWAVLHAAWMMTSTTSTIVGGIRNGTISAVAWCALRRDRSSHTMVESAS